MVGAALKYLALLFLVFLVACAQKQSPLTAERTEPIYSFVVAGHAYGNPETYTCSVYPPFLEVLKKLTETYKVNQLVLTGDVLAKPTRDNWETVRKELDALPIDEWHIAPGNHDVYPYINGNSDLKRYMAFERANSLFLLLNTTNPGWTIDSLQQVFIDNVLMNVDSSKRIFVFTHQLWWLKDTPRRYELDSVRPNSFALYEGEANFWKDGFQTVEKCQNEVYFFAGDMGCDKSLESYYEDHFDRFHFYGSGMGGGLADNFIYVRIFQDQTVKIDRIDF